MLGQTLKTKESAMHVCDEIEAKQQEKRGTERSNEDDRMEKYVDALETIQMNLQKVTSLQKELQELVGKADDADNYRRITKAIH